ncbi:hypothetical protein MPTK1_6g11330 [Marchantia polymorpha subsp. ruderalis]|uniref:NAD-dependent epimerase/dehydratase domain-containing protein n=2 Tax=Marchantia polymorpha TaxID=3197 RepID=A0AAF6BQW3_MARPO|nr:hypothetical protein MARPO_0016s0172 [Marchantia polymorpha]BBN14397.1 hypothetical protein Mp_6g11330 [Marchantia polymorpha subsp. ruderalis]|eukprot:PTQ45130.1 hypothetical protein MARPO_0016s0172 [Marchantia polymorpha]
MATIQAAACSNVGQFSCSSAATPRSSASGVVSWLCPSAKFSTELRLSSVSSFSQATSALQNSWLVKQSRREVVLPGKVAAARAAAGGEKNVLIVNTNSGGHAVIGFYFAKDLRAAGYGVTILTLGEEASDKMKKPPFSRFSELKELGVQTVWGSNTDIGAAVGSAKFEIVLDNNGKDMDAVKPVADWAKSSGAEQFLFISSAGIYKTTDEPPSVEGDAVKSAGHAEVEKYISELGFSSWASFRPQYMTGSGNNKDCEEWFFDRIVRGRPILVPQPGLQLSNVAHVSDLSSMLTLAVQKPEAANGQIFNAVSDRAVTLAGFARICAKAAGKEVEIITYDPKAAGVDAKKAFPFRTVHFYAEPRAAKELLGWTSKTNLPEDLKERYAEYIKIGRDKKDIKFELDDKILAAVKQPVTV